MVGVLLSLLVVTAMNLAVTFGIGQLTRPDSAVHRRHRRLVLDRTVARASADLDHEYEELIGRSR